MNQDYYDEDLPEIVARCEDCGKLIYAGDDGVYLDDDYNYFCSLECALNFHRIYESECCRGG